ncbi:MAG: lipocalin family protein [Agathobacter sp.]|nr:lipocalin family protein [Agathobacter sp.]
MKRIIGFACILCVIILFSGMIQKDAEVELGDYYMEIDPTIPPPCVSITDEQIWFLYDYMSSNLTLGTYVVEGDILTMTTDDGKEIYVFKVKGDTLVFQARKSSELKYVDEENAFKVYDGAKFKLGEWLLDN